MGDTAPIPCQRVIALRGPCDPQLTAPGAALLLADARGVQAVEVLDTYHLQVHYDLRQVGLEQLETALAEVGFHLDNSLLSKLRRALAYYTEENRRATLGLEALSCARGCAFKVFANRYRQLDHGCRDPRPEHLRRYL